MCSSSVARESFRPPDCASALSDTDFLLQTNTAGQSASTAKSSISSESNWCKRAHPKLLEDKLVATIKAGDVGSIENLLSELREYDGPLESSSLKLAMKVWNQWQAAEKVIEIPKSNRVEPDGKMLELRILSLCAVCKTEKAFAVLEEMAKSAEGGSTKEPRMSILAPNAILESAITCNNIWWSNKVLQFVTNHGLKPNRWTHILMMKAVGAHQDRRIVRTKYAELSAKFCEKKPLLCLKSAFVMTLANVGAVWEARLALEEMRSSMENGETGGDESTDQEMRPELDWMYTNAGEMRKAYHAVLRAAAAEGNPSLVKQLFHDAKEFWPGYTFFNLPEEYNMHLAATANAGDLKEFSTLAQLMQAKNIHMWPLSKIAWMKALCKQGRVTDALDILRKMKRKSFKYYGDLFRTIALASLRTGSLKNMKATLELAKASTMGPSSLAATMFAACVMDKWGPGASTERYLSDVRSFRENVATSSKNLHARVWALGRGGGIHSIMECMAWARKKKECDRWPLLNILIYNTAIHACRQARKIREMLELIEMMREDGCLRDVPTDNSLRDKETYGDADLRSALFLINDLREFQRPPDLFIFRYCIEVASHAGNLDDSVKLLAIMEREGIKPDLGSLRTIVFYAAQHGRLDVMEKMVGRMRADAFVVDADLCLAMVSAYAKARRYTDALAAVDTVQSRMCSSEGSSSNVESSVVAGLDAQDSFEGQLVVNFERLRELIERDRLRGL